MTKLRSKQNGGAIEVPLLSPSDQEVDAVARTLTKSEVQAASVIAAFQAGVQDINAVNRELSERSTAVRRGDMSRAESMLISQAHALEEIFSNLARRAHSSMSAGYPDAAERYLRLALKAQSQCRTTLEALSEIKFPKSVMFARQANVAHGPQQVNNYLDKAGAGGKSIPSNELSRGGSELLPDTRASQAESQIDPQMAAVGKVVRSENSGWKG